MSSILDQLQLLQTLIETDQKTIDAISAHLQLMQTMLKNLTDEMAQQQPADDPQEQKPGP